MNASEVCNQLSLYLGLDDETINQNVVPHLESLKSRAELQDYLTGLLGNETGQASFIQSYANARFPIAASQPGQPRPAHAGQATRTTPTTSAHNKNATTAAQASKMAAPASAHTPRPSPLPATRPLQAFPSMSSNSKLQVVQAPAVNLVAPIASLPSTSAYTLDHVASEQEVEATQRKLRQITMRLRAARGESKEKACFCQAQEHAISPVIPMCPRCLLVLCDLNVPYSRACPSCSYRPLADDHRLATHIASLEAEKADIDKKEKERLKFESEAEERARRAIQFPDLQDGRSPSPSGPQGHGGTTAYARKAGGGPVSHQQHVDQLYRNAQAREQAIAAAGERRVLSINSKTKKVQYQTIKPAGHAKGPSTAREKLEKLKKASKVEDIEDPRLPYVDEKDDGILRVAAASQEQKQLPLQVSWPPKQGSGLTYCPTASLVLQAKSIDEDDGAETEDGSSVVTTSVKA